MRPPPIIRQAPRLFAALRLCVKIANGKAWKKEIARLRYAIYAERELAELRLAFRATSGQAGESIVKYHTSIIIDSRMSATDRK